MNPECRVEELEAQLRAATDMLVAAEKIAPGLMQTAGQFAIGDVHEARARIEELERETADQFAGLVAAERQLEQARKELKTANFQRDKLTGRLWLVDTAVVELRSALSCVDVNTGHWRSHVQSALDLCIRATRKIALAATEAPEQ